MGNDSSSPDYKDSFRESFDYCVAKHTLNGDGSRGAYGDVATAKCIAERQFDKTWNRGSDYKRTKECTDKHVYPSDSGKSEHHCRGDYM
jgi:hypothetical protein